MCVIDGLITFSQRRGPFLVTRLSVLDPTNPSQSFPSVERALDEPNGLLAVGGGLEPERLLNAYRHGIFPWYEAGQPVLWWSPDPRAVLIPGEFKLHRSLRKSLRHKPYRVTFDENFEGVIEACASPRRTGFGTWITTEMKRSYKLLYDLGYAHSVEVMDTGDRLIGGLYGLSIGKVFFGESMFSLVRDASKIALATLACHLEAWHFALIDCQQETDHLATLGARPIPRPEFIKVVSEQCDIPWPTGPWMIDSSLQVDLWQPGLNTVTR